jgi:S-adenosylmethionine hydrolase
MHIITLTTDFGSKDHSVGSLKGAIYSRLPEARIVDISHQVTPFHVQEAAYIINNAYKDFPKGSIHLIGVDAEATATKPHILFRLDGHYFVTTNNGLLALIQGNKEPELCLELALPNSPKGSFPERDVFVPVVCHLAQGGKPELLGRPFQGLLDSRDFEPQLLDDGKGLRGHVIYIDHYGNLVTNIQKSDFEARRQGRSFKINAKTYSLSKFFESYSDILNSQKEGEPGKGGDLLALFNSSGYLELALYKSDMASVGGAASLLGIHYRDPITITFD